MASTAQNLSVKRVLITILLRANIWRASGRLIFRSTVMTKKTVSGHIYVALVVSGDPKGVA
jgi:hypothetical protein